MDRTPGYNTEIPDAIRTPDRVETRIGGLEFRDGFPTRATRSSSTTTSTSCAGSRCSWTSCPRPRSRRMRLGMVSLGATAAQPGRDHGPAARLEPAVPDRQHRHGLRLRVPRPRARRARRWWRSRRAPGPGPSTTPSSGSSSTWAAPGPDRGQGGRYLIVPDDFDGEVPDGYFVARSPSRVNWLILRGFLRDGRPDAAVASFTGGLRVYPLSAAANPPAMEFISGSGRVFNTIHANTSAFFEEVADVVAREPAGCIDPELRGLAASIGIRKDRPFAPDERMAGDPRRRGGRRQRDGARHRVRHPRRGGVHLPRQRLEDRVHRRRLPVADRRRDATAATSMPGPCSSTWPPSTRRPWPGSWSASARSTPTRSGTGTASTSTAPRPTA